MEQQQKLERGRLGTLCLPPHLLPLWVRSPPWGTRPCMPCPGLKPQLQRNRRCNVAGYRTSLVPRYSAQQGARPPQRSEEFKLKVRRHGLCRISVPISFFKKKSFGCSMRHMGSESLNQELNPHALHWKCGVFTTGEGGVRG